MLKTKDGHEIEVGMWIYDTDGMYEIIDICYGMVTVRGLTFDIMDNGTEECHLGDTLVFTSEEVSHMYFQGKGGK